MIFGENDKKVEERKKQRKKLEKKIHCKVSQNDSYKRQYHDGYVIKQHFFLQKLNLSLLPIKTLEPGFGVKN